MEYRVLGLLEVRDGGRDVTVGRGREGALLALLLAAAGRPVPVDRLVDELWEERPPENAVKTVQIYVSRLRARLGHDRIATTPTGYLLNARPEEVDAAEAERLIGEGRRQLEAGDPERAEQLLAEALALWRGDAYADFRYHGFAQAEIARLDELRSSATSDLVDARLALGQADELIPDLEALVRAEPLRERPRAQLMLAFYRAGRQADALELYQSTRTLFDAELGLEPGPELQALEHAILNQAPEVQRPRRPAPGRPQPGRAVRGTFVGRGGELEELFGALEEARGGRGRLFLVSGEPGIGKSRLLEELAADARARDVRVVAGRCREGRGAPAFWPWVQALRSLVAAAPDELLRSHAAALARILPELLERAPQQPEAGPLDADAERFALFDAVVRFLRDLSAAAATLVVLDDVHAADEPSLLLLRFLARELESTPVLVLAAYRDVDPLLSPPLAGLQSELAGSRVVSRLRLRGLGAGEVEEYVQLAASDLATPRLARRLYEETEGNPLFVSEAVRLLTLEGAPADDGSLRIPDSVRDVIARRLRHLSRPCLDVLETASILGREFDLAALADAAGVGSAALLELLDEAAGARVVADVPGTRSRLRFAHVLMRDTLYESLSLARRARLQVAVLEALERLSANGDTTYVAELAEHALAAGAADKAVTYAGRAAEYASSQRLHDEAARLLRLALESLAAARPADERARCGLLLELGEAETRAGDALSAKVSFATAADLARAQGLAVELARAAAGYGGGVVWGRAGDDHRLVPLLEEGLAALGDRDVELRIRLLSRLAGALRDEPARTRRDELSAEAVELARRSGTPALLGYALSGRGHAIAGPDTLDECLSLGTELRDVARQTGTLERVVAAHSLRIVAQLMKSDLDAAERELAASTAVAEEIRHAVALWDVTSTRALLAQARGDLDAAQELTARALAMGERALPDAAPAIHTMQTAALADFRGGLEEVEQALRSLAAATTARPVFRCGLAYVHARLGRSGDAARTLDELSRDRFAAVPFDQEWLYAISFLAEAAALVGHRSTAELYSLLSPWEELTAADVGEGFRGSVARYLGLLAAAGGRAAAARGHYEAALAANARMGARPWLAHTQCDLARLLLGDGGRDRAQALLAEALATYEAAGMTPHADGVRTLLARA